MFNACLNAFSLYIVYFFSAGLEFNFINKYLTLKQLPRDALVGCYTRVVLHTLLIAEKFLPFGFYLLSAAR